MPTLFDDTELFSSGELRVKHFDIPDARLTLWEHFFNRSDSDKIYKTLREETPWAQNPITVYNQTHLTPRLTCWYGKRWQSNKPVRQLTPTLEMIKQKVELEAGVQFTTVLLNLYRDGRDSVGWHRDNEKEYGINPTIGSVSFGETRPFDIRHKYKKEIAKIRIPLEHGSFLLMAGPMQHYWEHSIPKTAKPIQPRINLTFRIIP